MSRFVSGWKISTSVLTLTKLTPRKKLFNRYLWQVRRQDLFRFVSLSGQGIEPATFATEEVTQVLTQTDLDMNQAEIFLNNRLICSEFLLHQNQPFAYRNLLPISPLNGLSTKHFFHNRHATARDIRYE